VAGGEGVKTTENKINWPCGDISKYREKILSITGIHGIQLKLFIACKFL
jgi:hypothetical protein